MLYALFIGNKQQAVRVGLQHFGDVIVDAAGTPVADNAQVVRHCLVPPQDLRNEGQIRAWCVQHVGPGHWEAVDETDPRRQIGSEWH